MFLVTNFSLTSSNSPLTVAYQAFVTLLILYILLRNLCLFMPCSFMPFPFMPCSFMSYFFYALFFYALFFHAVLFGTPFTDFSWTIPKFFLRAYRRHGFESHDL
jgi:hypothetical protein